MARQIIINTILIYIQYSLFMRNKIVSNKTKPYFKHFKNIKKNWVTAQRASKSSKIFTRKIWKIFQITCHGFRQFFLNITKSLKFFISLLLHNQICKPPYFHEYVKFLSSCFHERKQFYHLNKTIHLMNLLKNK